MFSVCYNCGTLLMVENTYPRMDTMSGMHARCKACYVKLQLGYNQARVKPSRTIYLLITVAGVSQRVEFESDIAKREYLRARKSLAKFGKFAEQYSSKVGCCEDWGTGHYEVCDECDGLLRYSEKGELVCEDCAVSSTLLPVPLERECAVSDPSKKRSQFEHGMDPAEYGTDVGCIDFYYGRAYSRYLRK